MIKDNYEKQGWEFKEDRWCDYTSRLQVDLLFKSPRMSKFCIYNNMNRLDEREAECMAMDVYYKMKDDHQSKLIQLLKKFYLDYPNSTIIPEFELIELAK